MFVCRTLQQRKDERGKVKKGKGQVGYSGKHRPNGLKHNLVINAYGNPLNFTLIKGNGTINVIYSKRSMGSKLANDDGILNACD